MPPFRRLRGMMPASIEKNIGICRWKCVKYYQKCVTLACNYFKKFQLLGDFPRSPTGDPPLDPAGDSRPPDSLWFCPHPEPPSAAFDTITKYCHWQRIIFSSQIVVSGSSVSWQVASELYTAICWRSFILPSVGTCHLYWPDILVGAEHHLGAKGGAATDSAALIKFHLNRIFWRWVLAKTKFSPRNQK